MKTTDFDYQLPRNLIANAPKHPRDESRLFVYSRKNNQLKHKKFAQIIDYLEKGDILVLNNTKVMPARLLGHKEKSGGKAELLLLKQLGPSIWECLVKFRGKKPDAFLTLPNNLSAQVIKKHSEDTWQVRFETTETKFKKHVQKYGQMPIPPYIKRKGTDSKLTKQYQTIFAKHLGSAAAPTAGLHFTPKLLQQIRKKGVSIKYITLHVGLGTFQPVKTEHLKNHKMHTESYKVSSNTYNALKQAKKQSQRIICAGTTTVRVLETLFSNKRPKLAGETDIFIYPGYEFKAVDAIITNFHLPKSTLLMLISAFVNRKKILQLYQIAIEKKYRFYSFGDAMFIF